MIGGHNDKLHAIPPILEKELLFVLVFQIMMSANHKHGMVAVFVSSTATEQVSISFP